MPAALHRVCVQCSGCPARLVAAAIGSALMVTLLCRLRTGTVPRAQRTGAQCGLRSHGLYRGERLEAVQGTVRPAPRQFDKSHRGHEPRTFSGRAREHAPNRIVLPSPYPSALVTGANTRVSQSERVLLRSTTSPINRSVSCQRTGRSDSMARDSPALVRVMMSRATSSTLDPLTLAG